MTLFAAIGASFILISLFALDKLMLSASTVLASCRVDALVIKEVACRAFSGFFCVNELECFLQSHVLVFVT